LLFVVVVYYLFCRLDNWYNYEEWREGDRLVKKSRYIPKNRRSLIEKMNNKKAPVEEILKVLSNKGKRKK
jgi:hypothetical protein